MTATTMILLPSLYVLGVVWLSKRRGRLAQRPQDAAAVRWVSRTMLLALNFPLALVWFVISGDLAMGDPVSTEALWMGGIGPIGTAVAYIALGRLGRSAPAAPHQRRATRGFFGTLSALMAVGLAPLALCVVLAAAVMTLPWTDAIRMLGRPVGLAMPYGLLAAGGLWVLGWMALFLYLVPMWVRDGPRVRGLTAGELVFGGPWNADAKEPQAQPEDWRDPDIPRARPLVRAAGRQRHE